MLPEGVSYPSAFVFDIDDTLYDLAAPYYQAYSEVFGERYDLPVEQLFVLSREKSDAALELLTEGRITAEDHKVLRVQWTFADFGVTVTREEALRFQTCYARAQEVITLYPEAVEMLDAVKAAGLPLAALTNGDADHQIEKAKRLGLYDWFDDGLLVASGALGINKPATELFWLVGEKLGMQGPSVWYVGDTYETDVVGAKRAGWSCLWLDCRGRRVPDVVERPDIVVHTPADMRDAVFDLLALLEC